MGKIKQTMDTTLLSDWLTRPEYLGLQSLLSPFIQHSSAQRSMMFASHAAQSMVIDGAEQARVMTGYEKLVGNEEITKCRVTQDIIIRRVIPKFNPSAFSDGTSASIPSWTVIYTGEDGQVHSMEVSTYTYLHDGFGYFNKMLCLEEDRLYPGNVVQKGTKLTTSPNHDGSRWMMGTNANVIYIGEWGCTEDACVISRSLAEKGKNLAIFQTKLSIGIDDIPLDLYGDGTNYKCFPGIGEQVRSDGVLIGLRRNNESTFVSDMVPSRLRETEIVHDELHRAPPGSTVIDVDVYVNKEALKRMKDRDDSIYKQFLDFHKAQDYFYNSVLDTYTKLCTKEGEGLPVSPEFSNLVVKSACLSNNRKFVNKSFIHGNFVSRGFESSGFGKNSWIVFSCLRRFNQDFSADGILDDVHLLVFHEFEENEEGHDDFFFALLGFQKGAEFGPGVCLQISADIESLGIDVDFFAPDFSEPAPDRITSALFSAEDFSEDFFQLFQVSALEEILIVYRRLVGAHFFGKVLRTKITHACLLPADSELFGHIFIHLVFQKAPDQLFAGIAFLFTGLFVFFPGKEHAALDIQKGRRHDEKFTCDVHVLVIHLMDIFEVLVSDLNDRNIVDVYFVFFNQVHEQVQRAFEHRKLYGNCHN